MNEDEAFPESKVPEFLVPMFLKYFESLVDKPLSKNLKTSFQRHSKLSVEE